MNQPRRLLPEKEVVARYLAGESCPSLGSSYGVNEKTIRIVLDAAGVPRRRSGSPNVASKVCSKGHWMERRNCAFVCRECLKEREVAREAARMRRDDKVRALLVQGLTIREVSEATGIGASSIVKAGKTLPPRPTGRPRGSTNRADAPQIGDVVSGRVILSRAAKGWIVECLVCGRRAKNSMYNLERSGCRAWRNPDHREVAQA